MLGGTKSQQGFACSENCEWNGNQKETVSAFGHFYLAGVGYLLFFEPTSNLKRACSKLAYFELTWQPSVDWHKQEWRAIHVGTFMAWAVQRDCVRMYRCLGIHVHVCFQSSCPFQVSFHGNRRTVPIFKQGAPKSIVT